LEFLLLFFIYLLVYGSILHNSVIDGKHSTI